MGVAVAQTVIPCTVYCNTPISILCLVLIRCNLVSFSSLVSDASLSRMCYNLVSLSSGVSTANLSCWLVLIRCNLASLALVVSAASLFRMCSNVSLSPQEFQLPTFHAGWCSSAVIFLLRGFSCHSFAFTDTFLL